MLFTRDVVFDRATPAGRPRLAVLHPPADAPAPFRSGCWQVGWTEYRGEGQQERVGFVWSGTSGSVRVRSARFEVRDGGRKDEVIWTTTLENVDLPSTADGRLQSPLVNPTSDTLRFTIKLELQVETPCRADEPSELAQRFAAFAAGQAPNNVLLYFPRSRRQLWTTEQTLQQSPYFASLLSSGFAEASVTSATTVDADSVEPLPYDDSDDEAKLPLDSKRSPPLPPAVAPHKTVNITEASYSTYLAVICWMQSGHIAFAPLTSSLAPLGASSGAAAQASSKQGPPPTPSSPLVPVSPKSVYRLSHLLELPALTALALANYVSQLRISDAAYELFSETSSLYDPLFDAACKIVVENAKEVFETKGMREAEGRMEDGTMGEWEGRAWGRLARRLGRKM